MKADRQSCAVCASLDIEEINAEPYAVTFEGTTYQAPRVASRCNECGWSWVSGRQLDRNRDEYDALVSGINGYVSPDQVLTLREIYEISHEDAAAVLGITEDQYIKYEHNEAEVPRELGARMLAAMDNNEEFVAALIDVWRRRRQPQ